MIFNQDTREDSSYVINVANEVDDDGLYFDEEFGFTSLHGSTPCLSNGFRNRSLSEHFSTSSPSLERIKKLTRKLQSVFGSQDGNFQPGKSNDDPETEVWPLVSNPVSRRESTKRKSKPVSKVAFDESSLKTSVDLPTHQIEKDKVTPKNSETSGPASQLSSQSKENSESTT